MCEKSTALLLVNMAKDRIEEIRKLFEQIADIDTDYVWAADEETMNDSLEKLEEVFYDIRRSIRH